VIEGYRVLITSQCHVICDSELRGGTSLCEFTSVASTDVFVALFADRNMDHHGHWDMNWIECPAEIITSYVLCRCGVLLWVKKDTEKTQDVTIMQLFHITRHVKALGGDIENE
jgi:hypothetical protein